MTVLITRRVPRAWMASKHSVVRLVCLAAENGANMSGANSARKQYLPGCVGVNAAEVAEPLTSVTAEPTWLPPVVQSGFETRFGPQTKKVTLPLTAPLGLARVAVSVTDPVGSVTEEALTWVSKLGGIGETASDESERSWLPPAPSRSRK